MSVLTKLQGAAEDREPCEVRETYMSDDEWSPAVQVVRPIVQWSASGLAPRGPVPRFGLHKSLHGAPEAKAPSAGDADLEPLRPLFYEAVGERLETGAVLAGVIRRSRAAARTAGPAPDPTARQRAPQPLTDWTGARHGALAECGAQLGERSAEAVHYVPTQGVFAAAIAVARPVRRAYAAGRARSTASAAGGDAQ